MAKTFMTKHKTLTAIIAASLALVILLGGTFAWQSISQTALNEVYGSVNPGGRLHDDFNDITDADDLTRQYDKNVYVENFTSLVDNGVQIFARIRLDEYMEFGKGAGTEGNETAKSLVSGAELGDKSTWTTHIPGNTEDPFLAYWDWDAEGGQTTYLPTFNKNKDSLEADINGTFLGGFDDYKKYTAGKKVKGESVYDADDNTEDEIVKYNWDAATAAEYGNVEVKDETHTAKETLGSTVITMADYIARLNDDDPSNDTGNFWVWDTDGWAYWANPINPDTATGLLLDGISRTDKVINEDWYYAINVVAQFITKEDIGYENGTGFYDDKDGSVPPSDKALLLLDKIGVDVTFEVETAEELENALARGGNITLTKDITVDTNLVVKADTVLDLNDHTISNDADMYNTDNKIWSLISVQGSDTHLTINGGEFVAKENDCYAVDVRDGAAVTINDGTFVGNISAVYVYEGTAVINGGDFSIKQIESGENGYRYLLNAYDENFLADTAVIKVYGGTFHNFDPSAANDGSYVAEGYVATGAESEGEVVYTVSKAAVTE